MKTDQSLDEKIAQVEKKMPGIAKLIEQRIRLYTLTDETRPNNGHWYGKPAVDHCLEKDDIEYTEIGDYTVAAVRFLESIEYWDERVRTRIADLISVYYQKKGKEDIRTCDASSVMIFDSGMPWLDKTEYEIRFRYNCISINSINNIGIQFGNSDKNEPPVIEVSRMDKDGNKKYSSHHIKLK